MKSMKLAMAVLFVIFIFGSVQVYAADSQMQGEMTGQSQTLKASNLMGKTLNDQQGQQIGSLSDLVIDQDGQIQFVVLQPADELQKQDQLIPIPWQKIQAQADQEALTVAVDMQKLKDAPTITQDQFDRLTSQDMQSQVRGYYGVEEEMQQPGMMMEQDQMQHPGMREGMEPGGMMDRQEGGN